jgi:hypothetical protein
MPRRKVPPQRKTGSGSKASSRDSVKPVRLPHWRADGNAKVRYPSEAEANRAGFAYRLEHGADLNAYQCEYCNGWHLGASDER